MNIVAQTATTTEPIRILILRLEYIIYIVISYVTE